MKNILLILILFNALVWFGCNNKNGIKDSGTSKLNKIEDSLEDRKRNLDKKFEKEKLANEKKI